MGKLGQVLIGMTLQKSHITGVLLWKCRTCKAARSTAFEMLEHIFLDHAGVIAGAKGKGR